MQQSLTPTHRASPVPAERLASALHHGAGEQPKPNSKIIEGKTKIKASPFQPGLEHMWYR